MSRSWLEIKISLLTVLKYSKDLEKHLPVGVFRDKSTKTIKGIGGGLRVKF